VATAMLYAIISVAVISLLSTVAHTAMQGSEY
jgi:Flp pilus assembly pilin Flp